MCICLSFIFILWLIFSCIIKSLLEKVQSDMANKFNVQKTSFFLNYCGQSDFSTHCPSWINVLDKFWELILLLISNMKHIQSGDFDLGFVN